MVASPMLYYLCKPQELHYTKSSIIQYSKSDCISDDHCPVLCIFYSIYQRNTNFVFEHVANWNWNKQVFITQFSLDEMSSDHWIFKLSLKQIQWGGQHVVSVCKVYYWCAFYILRILIHLIRFFIDTFESFVYSRFTRTALLFSHWPDE